MSSSKRVVNFRPLYETADYTAVIEAVTQL